MLEAFRADRIEQLIDRIEKSARGDDLKYPDWRAALALLKITDQKRFGEQPAVESNPLPVINIKLITEAIREARRARAERLLSAGNEAPAGTASIDVETVGESKIRVPVRRKENHEQ